jgi:hypothetical protein
MKTTAADMLKHDQQMQRLQLPDDFVDAYEQFKLSILRNNAERWTVDVQDKAIMALWHLIQLINQGAEQ